MFDEPGRNGLKGKIIFEFLCCYSVGKLYILDIQEKEPRKQIFSCLIDSSFDNELTDRTFNETCCQENGVSYECMANCKDARGPRYEGFRMRKLHSRCTKFEHIIEKCIIKGKNKLQLVKHI